MKSLLILLMLANATDATLTARGEGKGRFYEFNPLMRPIVQRGPPTIGVAFGVGSLGEYVGMQKLAKRHGKWEKAWVIETTARNPLSHKR